MGIVTVLPFESEILLGYSILRDHMDYLFMFVKLAEITLLLEELSMVVSTIKTMFMGHVIWWAYYTTSMAAPEATLMVTFPINTHLKPLMIQIEAIESQLLEYKIW